MRARRAEYLRRIGGGEPDERERLIISSMIEAEWSALQSEAQAKEEAGKLRLASLRISAEHRRQLFLLDRDLTVAIRQREQREERAAAKRGGPPQIDLDRHVELLRQRREGAV